MILKQRTLVQIKHVWITPHGRFQAVLTRCPAPLARDQLQKRPVLTPGPAPAAGALREQPLTQATLTSGKCRIPTRESQESWTGRGGRDRGQPFKWNAKQEHKA